MRKKIAVITALCFMLAMVPGCGQSESSEGVYQASEVSSTLSMADEVKAYYDKVDLDYGYDLAYDLAYNEDLSEYLGWRLAGSEAEHKTADYLVEEMKEIGLENVDKIGVQCDSFTFKDSALTIEGTEISLQPASYQCNGTGSEGIDAEIVDVGTGTVWEFEEADVKDKIVLAGIDQWNEAWICSYIDMAAEYGAAALVTYSEDGYGAENDDTVNVQDICTGDYLPTCAISKNEAAEIKEAMEAGNTKCHLMLDAVMGDDDGTTYNVVGMIPGKSHDQRIIISGHYDKYWAGFQDDSAAIGLVFTVAKAMIDSGYEPENDIVFICHGAEEWGTSDSMFDWTTGAWGMTEEQSDYADNTIAMINCELPAFTTETGNTQIVCVPEFRTIASKLLGETGLVVTTGEVGITSETADATVMEDGISYRWHGVPYFINGFEDETFVTHKYHTTEDNADTYDADTFGTNINWYGALAMYLDTEPALELDMTQTAADLKANLNEDVAEQAGIDTEEYLAEVDELNTAAEALNEKIAACNSEYEEAAAAGDEDAMAAAREEGLSLNKTSLEAFQKVQDELLLINDSGAYIGHPTMNDNIVNLNGVITGLENETLWGDDEDGALDFAWQLNAGSDYGFCIFSTDVAQEELEHYNNENLDRHRDQWGYEKMAPLVYVGETTHELAMQAEEDEPDVDWEASKKVYQNALDEYLDVIKDRADDEIDTMEDLTEMIS